MIFLVSVYPAADGHNIKWGHNCPGLHDNDIHYTRILCPRSLVDIQYSKGWFACNASHVLQIEPYDLLHYNAIIMGAKASQITSLTIVYSIVYSDADDRKHQSPSSLAFV